MPKQSPFQYAKETERAIKLYKEGLTLRDVAKIIGKSHTWVWGRVKKLSPNSDIDKGLQGE